MRIAFDTVSKPIGIFAPKMSQNPNFTSSLKPSFDVVSFTHNIEKNKINLEENKGVEIAKSLSSSTAGHRAKWMSEDFNPNVMELLASATGEYLKEQTLGRATKPLVVIGGDTRTSSRESLPKISDTLTKQGLNVILIDIPTPSPILAMATKETNADLGILLTASHNPWDDAGFNLVTNEAAIAPIEITGEIGKKAEKIAKNGYYLTDKTKQGIKSVVDPYEMYKSRLENIDLIDWDTIRNSNISIHYDGLKGCGEKWLPRLLNDNNIPVDVINSPKKSSPNPIDKNLSELKDAVKNDKNPLAIGLSNDGDADRLGIIDENGNLISINDTLLLALYHLDRNKGKKGAVIKSHATSSKLDLYAKQNDLKLTETPVGFKYLGNEILNERKNNKDIIIAGEESGGFTVFGHIPEKDGILGALIIADLVAKENKPLSVILKSIKEDLGKNFEEDNFSLKLKSDKEKNEIILKAENIRNRAFAGDNKFGNFEIDPDRTKSSKENIEKYRPQGDGVKLCFTDNSTLLIRKSGTENLVKFYFETVDDTEEGAKTKLSELKETTLKELK